MKRWQRGAGAAALASVLGCGISVGRDLSQMPPQAVVYDDVCKVQDYFDALAQGHEKAPNIGTSSEVQKGEGATGGITRFIFETDSQLRNVRRVLSDNWTKLPPKLMTASKVELTVKWSEKASVRRVVTTEDAELTYDGTSSFLPYHICLSEFLFGAPLYKTRRELLGLPALAPPSADAAVTAAALIGGPDGGAPFDAQPGQ